MPKISELPGNAGLTGDELIPIVQGGETRKVNLGELANMSVPPSIRGIRWFHDSEGGYYLNSLVQVSGSLVPPAEPPQPFDEAKFPLIIYGKADAYVTPLHILMWDVERSSVVMPLDSDPMDQSLVETTGSNQEKSLWVNDGVWTVQLTGGDFSDPARKVIFEVKSDPTHVIDTIELGAADVGRTLNIYVKKGASRIFMFRQFGNNFSAPIEICRVGYFEDDGQLITRPNHDQLEVCFNARPLSGSIIAVLHVRDENTALRAVSDNIIIAVTEPAWDNTAFPSEPGQGWPGAPPMPG
ncbi:hypothetical protein CCP4SC76_810011 [Gammaproteobacteria bacterium]